MWLVSQANSVILEVKVEPNAIGQECLEKVCEKLEIGAEADYFGLRVCAGAGPGRWLNLRNRLDPHRIPGNRLELRVKFWVPPHLLINEPTRHQFYLHARRDLVEGRLVAAEPAVAARLGALIAQAEAGDCAGAGAEAAAELYRECARIGPQGERADQHAATLLALHRELRGTRASQAEYRLLKEIARLESFGEELFFCKPCAAADGARALYTHMAFHGARTDQVRGQGGAGGEEPAEPAGCLPGAGPAQGCGCRLGIALGVGPLGLVVYRPACGRALDVGQEKQSIPYSSILRAQPVRRQFQLSYVSGAGQEAALSVKMLGSGQAAALYRAVTEKHAFYCCDTVRRDVTEQFIRDLKGTIASIFRDSSRLGRRYVFDIRRTCREVHDRARRRAHGHAPPPPPAPAPAPAPSPPPPELRCRVCMDCALDSVLLPCRHVLCCQACAARCERCPLCRSEIEQVLRIYLPVDYDKHPASEPGLAR